MRITVDELNLMVTSFLAFATLMAVIATVWLAFVTYKNLGIEEHRHEEQMARDAADVAKLKSDNAALRSRVHVATAREPGGLVHPHKPR